MYESGTLRCPRTTCLYCALRGITTDLIPFAHWGICPKCDPERARALLAPDPDKGKPSWPRRA